MANNCFYDMHIVGKKDDVDYLIDQIKEGKTGRVFSVDVYEYEEKEESDYPYMYQHNETHAYICGDCAWSVFSTFLTANGNNFKNILKSRKLLVEIYSEEPGCGFMEHYMWEFGEERLNETRDYYTETIDNLEEDQDALEEFLENELVKEKGITKDNYKDFADDDGWITIGGFEWIWEVN